MSSARHGFGLLTIGVVIGFVLANWTRPEPAADVPTTSYEEGAAPAPLALAAPDPVTAQSASASQLVPESVTIPEIATLRESNEEVGQVAPETSLAQSDAEVRQLMISASSAAYSGSCPCPYSVDRAGRSCGARSAYSRPGGASPYCFPEDISSEALLAFRATLN